MRCGWGVARKIQDAQAVAGQGCWVGGGVLMSRTINRKFSHTALGLGLCAGPG